MTSGGRAWLPTDVADRTRLVELPFGRVFTVDVGPGSGEERLPPLVLVHGLFVTHYAFDRLIPLLARNRRVVALDLPGAGDSDPPVLEADEQPTLPWWAHAVLQTVDALDIGAFDLLGHDVGGTIALHLAADRSSRVRRLILLDPVALSVSLPLEGTLAVVPSFGAEVFRRALRKADLRRFLVQSASTPELVTDAQLGVYWDRLGRPGAREATYAMLEQLSSVVRLRDRFEAVRAPTLVLWGDRDRIVPAEQGERLVELLPQARLQILEGCGHNPADERPETVAELVEQHGSGS